MAGKRCSQYQPVKKGGKRHENLCPKKLVTKSWKQMLLLFDENLPQNKQHFDRAFYKWISYYCTYYFLNAYVFEPLLCG